jgi:uncharacterized membrane protein
MSRVSPARIALAALLIPLTTVLTVVARVPIGTTGGYLNLSDVAIVFTGLTFGPWIGMVAGGVGAAWGDVILGAPQFAPLSLLAHGLQGLLIGWIGYRQRRLSIMLLAWLAGAVAMVGCYFLGEGLVLYQVQGSPASAGWVLAAAEVPWNVVQATVGGILGIALTLLVRKAYPRVDQLGQRRTWTE